MSHEPAATVPVHASTPSLTVTFPVGVPLPAPTSYWTLTTWPTTDGSGLSEMIVVVVGVPLTVCASGADVLGLKFESPS